MFASARAIAQTTQPSDDSPRSAPAGNRNLFSLERLDAALEVSSEFEQRRVRNDGPQWFDATRQRNRRTTFDEQFLFDFDASVYDPNLLSIGGSIGLGLMQERYYETFNNDRDVDTNEGFLSTYDLRADFLRGKEISGTAYGLKSEDRYARPFLPSLREERNDYGFALYRTHETLPMQLTFDHRNVDRTGSRRSYDDENLTEDLLRYQATWITSAQHSLRFTYEYAENEERYSGSRDAFHNVRNQFRLDDELLFGNQNQHRLDAVLRFQDEQGDYARDLVELGPRMSLRHSDSLMTNYQYQYSREEIGGLEVDLHRADWQFVHQLYENLTSTFDLYGLAERVEDDSDTNEIGATADFSYTRNNRWGRFSADLSLTAESERTRGGGNRAVVAESGAFVDPLPVTLSRPDVIPWTIVVRDPARLRIYLPGLDYFVTRAADRTQLFRNPLGAIPNGGTVSIDYLYRVPNDGSRDSQLVNFRIQQDFENGLTPYYQLDFRHEDRDVPNPYRCNSDYESNRHRAGLRYRRDRWNAGGEFELLKDAIDPFIAYRMYSGVNLWRAPGRALDARADFSHYFFEDSDRGDTMILELGIDGRAEFSRALEGYLTNTYRYEDDGTRGRGTIHGVDLESGVSYRWGQFTLTASVEYDLLSIVQSREDGFTVWIKLRRDFPNLLGRAR